MNIKRVILIHGLWMRSPILWRVGHWLKKERFEIEYFNYSTTRTPFDQNIERLINRLNSTPDGELGIVAHSLGGILTASAATRVSRTGRIVLLGSPILGSRAGATISKHPLTKKLAGHTGDVWLNREPPAIPEDWEVGAIAGNSSKGLGRILAPFREPNDGTVLVSETLAPGLKEHLILPVGHTSMLFSREVISQTVNFLKEGKFITGRFGESLVTT